MKIADNKVVTFDFTLKNKQGEVLDSSEGNDPLKILVGFDNIIPGLEQALIGKSVGDSFEVEIEANDAYGQHNPEAIQTLPITLFEEIEGLEVGMQLMADTDQGPRAILITEITDGLVTVDGNHELAGQDLHFAVSITEVRDAEDEEIAHGHAH